MKKKKQNPYIIYGVNSLHLKTLKHGDVINREQYLEALKLFNANSFDYIIVKTETGHYKRLKKESLIQRLIDFGPGGALKLRCVFRDNWCNFEPVYEN